MNKSSRNHIFIHAGILLALVASTSHADLTSTQFQDATEAATFDDIEETWGQAIGDINNDGYPDLFIGHHGWTPTAVFRNNQNGTFTNVIDTDLFGDYEQDKDSHSVTFADFDNDGHQEIVEVQGAFWDNEVWIKDEFGNYQTQPSGTGPGEVGFRYPVADWGLFSDNPYGRRSPMFLDFDQDGLLDVFVTARVGSISAYQGNVALFRNAPHPEGGDGTFFEFVDEADTDLDYTTPITCDAAQYHDLNGDGKLDVMCADTSRLSAVFEVNDTPPYLSDLRPEIGEELFNRWPYDLAVGDFNGDGRNDVFTTSARNAQAVAYQVDLRTVYAKIADMQDTGFSFIANGDIFLEFSAYTNPNEIFLGSGAISPPWSTNIGTDGEGGGASRVQLTLSASDSQNLGIASDQSGRGVYIGFINGRWQVMINLSNTREPGVTVQAGTLATGAISGLQSIPAGVVDLTQGGLLNAANRVYFGNESGQFDEVTLNQFAGSCNNVVAGDFDNDMDLDVYTGCTGYVANLANMLFENDGNGNFTLIANAGGAEGDYAWKEQRLENLGRSDAVMTWDYDRDGCLDLFVANSKYQRPFSYSGRQRIFNNTCNGNNWAEFRLVGVDSNRDAIGSTVYLETPDGTVQMREMSGGTHYHAQDDTMLHFGLAQESSMNVRVVWPDGSEDYYDSLAINQVNILTQGGGSAVPVPTISIADVTVDESAGTADFVVTLSSSSTDVVSVAYDTADGTALAGSDYTATSDTLNFTAGVTSQNISVPITDDVDPEDAETFTVTLNTPSNATILDGSATGTIAVNDGFGGGGGFTLSVGNITVGEDAGTAEFTVNLTPAPGFAEAVDVSYSTSNDTATAPEDFTSTSGTLNFTEGVSQLSVSVPVVNDEDAEPTEAFILDLLSADTDPASATATILDNDSGSAPVCGEPDFDRATETAVFLWNDCGDPQQWHMRATAGGVPNFFRGNVTSNLLFESLAGFSIEASDSLTADFSTATAGPIDFVLAVGGSGQDGFEFRIQAGAEACFDLTSPPVPVWVGSTRIAASVPVSLTTLGSCGAPVLDLLTVGNVTVNEEAGTAEFMVNLTPAPGAGETVDVNFSTADSTATAPDDFTSTSGTLSFAEGVTQLPVSVPVVNDTDPEPTETFSLQLNSTSTNSVTATASILDNDGGSNTAVCGQPNFDQATETAVFLWNDCGDLQQWHMRATAGGVPTIYSGSVSSNQLFESLVGFSIELSDTLPDNFSVPTAGPIPFSLRVGGTGQDGFEFRIQAGADACFDLPSPSVPVLMGSTRIAATVPVNLATLEACVP